MESLDKSLDLLIKEERKERRTGVVRNKRKGAGKKKENTDSAKNGKPKGGTDIRSRLGKKKKGASVGVGAVSTQDILKRLGPSKGKSPVKTGKVGKRQITASTSRLLGKAAANIIVSPKKPAEISIKGESGPVTILVANLDRGASADDVRTCFKKYGEIRKCTLLFDGNGRSTGKAEIVYSRKPDAEKAVKALNGVIADGATLSVQILNIPPSEASTSIANTAAKARGRTDSGRGKRSSRGRRHALRKDNTGAMDIEADPQFNVVL
ncbi:hypothetical protein H4219_003279 [Mycoemilia scoparia]|uniref:RRM domain-containing protein n=1 Tax=Mycoemilia scoparia TaxID=417184 RepID=A0A9W7ZVA8_9FUNG|nr:hypothetical protein H4219_003279 [Mycoemilia scoparia]